MMRFTVVCLLAACSVAYVRSEQQVVEPIVEAICDETVASEAVLEEATGLKPVQKPEISAPRSMVCTFENRSGKKVTLWWEDGGEGVFQGDIENEGESMINSFSGHVFYFTEHCAADTRKFERKELYRVTMQTHAENVQLGDDREMARRTQQFEAQKNAFLKDYFERTGRQWRNYYPREPVKRFMYNATDVGDVVHTVSHVPHWRECTSLSRAQLAEGKWRRHLHHFDDTNEDIAYCRRETLVDSGEVDAEKAAAVGGADKYYHEVSSEFDRVLDVKMLCNEPRVYLVEDIVSDSEAEYLIRVGSPALKRSTLAQSAIVSVDRTSQTAWMERSLSPVVDDVVRRIADAVRIAPSQLQSNTSSESLQLVHYGAGELYKAHLDYNTHAPNSRFLTFVMYLNTPGFGGGNTSFPNAAPQCKDHNGYFGAEPKKGSAVFFYDLFPDGNADPKSLHFAEPPVDGTEKYMCNLWIWDPWFG